MDVSIIIPTYNRLWSLPKALDNCALTALNIEIIVIDDGSTDNTWEWLSTQKDIVAIRQQNKGKDWAVNAGVAIARGKYIRFLDSDDWLLPYSTDQLFDEAEKKSLDIVCAGYQLFDDNETLLKEISWTICDDFIAQQLGECDASHYGAYLFKKGFINDIPHRQEYGAVDDRKFIIETALRRPKIGYINTSTLAHRIHPNERLQAPSGLQASANHLALYNIYKKTFEALTAQEALTQRHKNAACNTLWHLAHWVAKTHIGDGKEIYDWVYQLNPYFSPTENQGLNRLYKIMGFTKTEKLLKLRRLLKD